jgi:sporulation protein YpjB
MFFKTRNVTVLFVLALTLLVVLCSGCSKEKTPETAAPVQPEVLKQAEQLNAAADDLYTKIMQDDVNGARTKLNELGDRLTQMRFDGMTTVEGVQALADSVVAAKRELNAVAYSKSEGQAAIARIRLATDALTHKNEPMWLQYYKGMKENLSVLQHAVQMAKKEEAQKSLTALSDQYDLIRPSVVISRNASEVEQMESLFRFMKTQLSEPKWDTKNISSGIMNMNATLDLIFQKKDTEAFLPIMEEPNPVLWITGIGSIIIAVLTFASWRIFRVERDIVGGGKSGRNNGRFRS